MKNLQIQSGGTMIDVGSGNYFQFLKSYFDSILINLV